MAAYLSNIAKTLGGAGGTLMSEFRKAQASQPGRTAPGREPITSTRVEAAAPISKFHDPLEMFRGMGGYRERPGQFFDQIRHICTELPPIGVIIMTRRNQGTQMARPAEDKGALGYRITTRNPKARMGPQAKKMAEYLTRFIEHTGNPDHNNGRDSFHHYMSKVLEDSLMFSQDTTEIVPDRRGKPFAFYAVDASTIRLAAHDSPYMDQDEQDDIRYVQLIDGLIATKYRHEQMIFGVRNPTSDIRIHGYGVSEIEKVLRAVASMMYAWDHNARVFHQGTNVRGVFNIPGLTGEELETFRTQLVMFLQGTDNAHTTPMTNAQDPLQYVDLTRSNRDMEFGNWFDTLLKLICAAYAIDPVECNFTYGAVGVSTGLSQPSNREKIIESRERGLVPLMDHFASNLNKRIIWPLCEDFKLSFVGLDAMTLQEREDYNAKRVRSTRTVNEIRAEDDVALLPPELGDIILDGVWLQNKMQVDQRKQMMANPFGGQPGLLPPGADGGVAPDSGDQGQSSIASADGQVDPGAQLSEGPASNAEAQAEPMQRSRSARPPVDKRYTWTLGG